MNTKKPLITIGLITALSVGSLGVAQASTVSVHRSSVTTANVVLPDPDAAVLAALVTAGTITQAQSTTILAALVAAHAANPLFGGAEGQDGMEGPKGIKLARDLSVITATLGITPAQLQADLGAGQSLATIAGTKTADLITALVAAETTRINARVTAGELTQAQATTLIANLSAAVTAAVNAVPTHGGPGHHGRGEGQGKGHGKGHGKGEMGAPSMSPNPAPSN